LVVDQQGSALMVWKQTQTDQSTDLYWSHAIKGGLFSAPAKLNVQAGAIRDVAVSIEPASGHAIIAWLQPKIDNGNLSDVWAIRVSPTHTLSNAQKIGSVDVITGQQDVQAGIDQQGRVLVTWINPQAVPNQTNTFKDRVWFSRFDGNAWSTAASISAVTGETRGDGLHSLSVNASGKAVLAWHGGITNIYASIYDGTWSTPTVIDTDGIAPFTSISANGQASVLWQTLSLNQGQWSTRLLGKRAAQKQWDSTARNVTGELFNGTAAIVPSVYSDDSGNTHVVWKMQNGAQQSVIYHSNWQANQQVSSKQDVRPPSSEILDGQPIIQPSNNNGLQVSWVARPNTTNNWAVYHNRLGTNGWGTPTKLVDVPSLWDKNHVMSGTKTGHTVVGWVDSAEVGTRFGTRVVAKRYQP
jgi:hypothetical protein